MSKMWRAVIPALVLVVIISFILFNTASDVSQVFTSRSTITGSAVSEFSTGNVTSNTTLNEPPIYIGPTALNTTANVPLVVDLNNYYIDPENDTLTFLVGDEAQVIVSLDNSILTLTPDNNFVGERMLSIVATDDVNVVRASVRFVVEADPFSTPVEESGFGSQNFSTSVTVDACAVINESTDLASDVQSNGTCFTINASNLFFNCTGFEIRYSENGTPMGRGIQVTDGQENITIRNCIIRDINSSGSAESGILLDQTNDSLVFNNTFFGNGTSDVAGVRTNDAARRNRIVNNTFSGAGISTTSSATLNNFTGNVNLSTTTLSGTNKLFEFNTLLGELFMQTGTGTVRYNNITVISNLNNLRGVTTDPAGPFSIDNNIIMVFSNGTGNIGFRHASTTANFSNNTIFVNGTTNVRGLSIEASSIGVFSSNNNITALGNDSTAIEFEFAVINTSRFDNTTLTAETYWIQLLPSPSSANINFTNTTFRDMNGSIFFPEKFQLNDTFVLSRQLLNVTENNAFVNSTNLSFMNHTATISLNDITFADPKPIVDFGDDGSFEECPSGVCTEVSFTDNVFVYNVTQFTSYSSNENSTGEVNIHNISQCGTINTSARLTTDISSNGTCITFNNDAIFLDCAGFTITYGNDGALDGSVGVNVTNLVNATIKNCVINKGNLTGGERSYGIELFNASFAIVENNTINTNGTTENDGIHASGSATSATQELVTNDNNVNNPFCANSTTDVTIDSCKICFETPGISCANLGDTACPDGEGFKTETLVTFNLSSVTVESGLLQIIGGEVVHCSLNNLFIGTLGTGNNCGAFRAFSIPASYFIADVQNNLSCSVAGSGKEEDNGFKLVKFTYEVAAQRAGNISIRNNTIVVSGSGNYTDGILVDISNSTIANNTIITTGSHFGHGLALTAGSQENQIENNTITALPAVSDGINVERGKANTFVNNTVISATRAHTYLERALNNTFNESNITLMTSGTSLFLEEIDGIINYTETINLIQTLTLADAVNISLNFTQVNTSVTAAEQLNKSAGLALFGMPFFDSKAAVDFEDDFSFAACEGPRCSDLNYTEETRIFRFNVSSFTTYAAQELSTCTTLDLEINVTEKTFNLINNVTSTGTCMNIVGDNITLDCDGFEIRYNTLGGSANYGIVASGTSNIIMQNCIIVDNSSTGSGGAVYFNLTNHSQLLNSNITSLGASNNDGVLIRDSINSTATGNRIEFNGTTSVTGFRLTELSTDATISYNSVNVTATSSTNRGVYVVNATGTNITGNNITVSGTTIIRGVDVEAHFEHTTISNNIFTINGTGLNNHGIQLLGNASNSNITKNTVTTRGIDSHGIRLVNVTTIRLEDNNVTTFASNDSYGIFMQSVLSSTLLNNTIVTEEDALRVEGEVREHWTTHEVNETNLGRLGGGSFRNISYFGGAGSSTACPDNQDLVSQDRHHITLIGCSGVTITDYTSRDRLTIVDSEYTTVNDTLITNKSRGIGVFFSAHTTLGNNTISTLTADHNYPIHIIESNYTNITANRLHADGLLRNYGILVEGESIGGNFSFNNITTNGTINNVGIVVSNSSSINIYETNITTGGSGSHNIGFVVNDSSSDNSIINSFVTTNGTSYNLGVHIDSSLRTTVHNTIIIPSGNGDENNGVVSSNSVESVVNYTNITTQRKGLFINISNSTVLENSVLDFDTLTNGSSAIEAINSSYSTIHNNRIIGPDHDGIDDGVTRPINMSDSPYTNITYNVISMNSSINTGINSVISDNNTILRNNISSRISTTAILITTSNNNFIADNNITILNSSGGDGISVRTRSTGTIIENNTIYVFNTASTNPNPIITFITFHTTIRNNNLTIFMNNSACCVEPIFLNTNSNDTNITDNILVTNGTSGSSIHTGVYVRSSSNVSILNNNMDLAIDTATDGNGVTGVQTQTSGSQIVRNLHVINNTIKGFASIAGGIEIGILDTIIENNTLNLTMSSTGNGDYAIDVGQAKSSAPKIFAQTARVYGNKIQGTGYFFPVLNVDGVATAVFDNNTVNISSNTDADIFATFESGTNASFSNNVVHVQGEIDEWIDTAANTITNFTNTVFDTPQGTIHFPGLIHVNGTQSASWERMRITQNRAVLNTSSLPFMNESAQITLRDITSSNPYAVIDYEDNDLFELCPSTICTTESFTNNIFVFNVTHFTTYASHGNATECPALFLINETLIQGVVANGSCYSFDQDNLALNCDGFELTGNGTGFGVDVNNLTQTVVRNCVIQGFDTNLRLNNVQLSNFINNTMRNPSSESVLIRTDSSNNTFKSNTISSDSVAALLIEGGANSPFFSDGFEDETLDPFTTSGNAAWNVNTSRVNSGSFSAMSGNVSDDEVSIMELNLTLMDASIVSFAGSVSSENNFDFFEFLIDGVVQVNISGDQDFVVYNSTVAAGEHNFTWRFAKDGSASSGIDAGFVDDFTVSASSTVSLNNSFNETTFYTNQTWIDIGQNASNNTFETTRFTAPDGNITIIPTVQVLEAANVTINKLNITSNLAYLNSTNLTFFNTTGEIVLNGISFTDPKPLIDHEDDGTFEDCAAETCVEISFANNVYVYNVTGFTTYSSGESSAGGINVTLSKGDNPDPVSVGGNVVYTITINVTGGNASNITLTDLYPALVVFINSTPNNLTGTNDTFIIGNLTAGDSFSVNITVMVNGGAQDVVINNTANISYQNSTGDLLFFNVTETTMIGNLSNIVNSTIDDCTIDNSNATNSVNTNCSIIDSTVVDSINTNSTISNSTVINSTTVNTTITDSLVNESTIHNSTIDNSIILNNTIINGTLNDCYSNNSNVTNSVGSNCTLIDSTLTSSTNTNSTLKNSNVTNSTVEASTILNSNVTNNSIVINSNVTNSTVRNSNLTNVTIINSTVIDSVKTNTVIINSYIINSTNTDSTIINTNETNSVDTSAIVDASIITGSDKISSTINNSNLTNANITDGSTVLDSTIIDSNVSNSNLTGCTVNNATVIAMVNTSCTLENGTFNLTVQPSEGTTEEVGGGGGGNGVVGITIIPARSDSDKGIDTGLAEDASTEDQTDTEQAGDSCIENWTCDSWSACGKGLQTRDCIDSSKCGTEQYLPINVQKCEITIEQPIEELIVEKKPINWKLVWQILGILLLLLILYYLSRKTPKLVRAIKKKLHDSLAELKNRTHRRRKLVMKKRAQIELARSKATQELPKPEPAPKPILVKKLHQEIALPVKATSKRKSFAYMRKKEANLTKKLDKLGKALNTRK